MHDDKKNIASKGNSIPHHSNVDEDDDDWYGEYQLNEIEDLWKLSAACMLRYYDELEISKSPPFHY